MGAERHEFEALYGAHASAVLAYARRRTDAASADDVLSDVFLVAWRRFEEVPTEPRAWLLGTARKVLANQRRGRARSEALREHLRHQRPPASPDPTQGAAVDGAVLRALAKLRDRDREALLLVAWDGLTPGQAAQVVGTPAATFTMRLSRARKRLVAALEADETSDGKVSAKPATTRAASAIAASSTPLTAATAPDRAGPTSKPRTTEGAAARLGSACTSGEVSDA